ncbi:thioredoxin-like protein [Crucibulum laeve]|uniref:Monothiol glutaredoxin-5, mitochondrial n=1 Tax=Crucibulum laeve TaxID=68775 RepID=A0A5C3M2T9_9AGAR|nr:thioredoxin-like protein [Crucibulum laeve]
MFRPILRSSTSLLTRTLAPSLSPLSSSSTLLRLRALSTESRSKIQGAIDSSPVVLFMKGTKDAPQCGFSRAVVQILDMHAVPEEKLKTYNVLADEQLRNDVKEFSEWPTIPQVYVNGEFVGGCDILLGMHQSGELETLLENNNIIPKVPEGEPASS